MEIELTKAASGILFRMFMQPAAMSPDQPYKAQDPIAKEDVIAICEWMNKSERIAKIREVQERGETTKLWEFQAAKFKLRKRYIDRIRDVCEHYKEAGKLMHNVQGYHELVMALDGKKIVLESVEED